MAQMNWNKYPEVMPPDDDQYLAVAVFHMSDGRTERSVMPLFFVHDMSDIDIDELDVEVEHRPLWYDIIPDFRNEEYGIHDLDVTYWMPFPELPEE